MVQTEITIESRKHRFPFNWELKNWYPVEWLEKHGLKVFSNFCCGGGSTMGYKLAWFDVIGANDIDPQMAKLYQKNHNPKHFFLCPIGEMLNMELPDELYNLDILDWSPPCSTFSMAWEREAAFWKKKKFREGQSEQVLSELFFDFIALADKLRPKVVIAENVKGMLIGNARAYVRRVIDEFEKIGYDVQLFLLNSAFMWLPQKRERVFFICKRKDLNFKNVVLDFNEDIVPFKEIDQWNVERRAIYPCDLELWKKVRPGQNCGKAHPKGHRFNSVRCNYNLPINTIAASDGSCFYHPEYPGFLTEKEMILAWSFPTDYDFCGMKPQYCVWMSVPPVMMANIAYEVYKQLFVK